MMGYRGMDKAALDAAGTGQGLQGDFLPLPEHDHFSILEELIAPEGRLTAALLDLITA